MKKYIYLIVGLLCILIQKNYSQNHLEIIRNNISSLLAQRQDGNFVLGIYMLDSFIEVDSVINNTSNDFTDFGITNPYQTLSNCVLFTAMDTSLNIFNRTEHFGVYKNDQIIWLSEGIEGCSRGRFIGTLDLNNDETVDIVTASNSGVNAEYEQVWIYSWDGNTGTEINEMDEAGYSLITILNSSCEIIDINGDNLYEIKGSDKIFNEDGEVSVIIEVYSWNGSEYGIWPDTPVYLPDTYSIANYISAEVFITLIKETDSLSFNYQIKNNSNSEQSIKYIFITSLIKMSDVQFSFPDGWNFFTEIAPLVYFEAIENNAQIRKNTTLSAFKLKAVALPTINSVYLQAEHLKPDYPVEEFTLHYPEYLNDIYTNSLKIITICPEIPPSPFIPISFIDTLFTYNIRSLELGWITNQTTADKYDSLFTSAKAQLQQNNNNAARTTLQTVLQEVDIDSTDNLTSEAYALLHYNTEYLIGKIPAQIQLDISVINPAMSLVNPGAFTMEVKGSGFSSSSVVYFNGNARATTFVSDSTLNAAILASDVSAAGNFPVWVSDNSLNSDTLIYKIVSTLPQPVRPVLECVTNNGDGTYTAFFGYKNENSVSVYIPVGSKNKFTPNPQDRGQTRVFLPGRQIKVYTVNFNGSNLVWTLNGRTSTASANSAPCQ